MEQVRDVACEMVLNSKYEHVGGERRHYAVAKVHNTVRFLLKIVDNNDRRSFRLLFLEPTIEGRFIL